MTEQNQIDNRPLSPHLQVYRLPYNALMSISGRGVGIGLALAMVALCLLFSAAVWFPGFYDTLIGISEMAFVPFLLIPASFLVFFYLGNGIRHVLWHFKIGVNEKAGIMTGNIVLVVSVLLSIGIWQLTCGCWAGMSHDKSVFIEKVGGQNE